MIKFYYKTVYSTFDKGSFLYNVQSARGLKQLLLDVLFYASATWSNVALYESYILFVTLTFTLKIYYYCCCFLSLSFQ